MCPARSDNIYLDNGYLDIAGLVSTQAPFIFVAAARGTGKTYGACELAIERYRSGLGRFMFIRRTKAQADIIGTNGFSPFEVLEESTIVKKINEYVAGVYLIDESGEPEAFPCGYICGLSTFAKVRGFDGSTVSMMIYDEFIPEQHEKAFAKDEAEALWNAYETVNRNREFNGSEPVKLLCLANSNRLDNDYFLSLGIVGIAWDMMKSGRELRLMHDRGIAICLPTKSPISEKKAETALYKAVSKGRFRDMALSNDFGFDSSNIGARRLNEYRPVVKVGEICIYEHKSRYEFYVSRHKSGRVPEFSPSTEDLARFRHSFMWLWRAALADSIIYEDAVSRALFDKYYEK